ncbi:MAG: hypothetical protein WDM76_18660 [Limisphaerales bacterium]
MSPHFFFRSDWFDYILLFSVLSFGLTLGIFYIWLLLLSPASRKNGGGTTRPPAGADAAGAALTTGRAGPKIISPLAVTALLWGSLSWWFAAVWKDL